MKKIILVFLTVILAFGVCASGVSANENTYIANVAYAIGDQEGFDNFWVVAITLVPGETNSVVINGKTVVDDKTVEWTEEYDITLEQYLELFKVNNSNLVYDAETAQIVPEAAANNLIEAIKPVDMDVDLQFNGFGNEGFSRNLKYMGLGMLGIFAVVGVVILLTYVLNSSTGRKKAK